MYCKKERRIFGLTPQPASFRINWFYIIMKRNTQIKPGHTSTGELARTKVGTNSLFVSYLYGARSTDQIENISIFLRILSLAQCNSQQFPLHTAWKYELARTCTRIKSHPCCLYPCSVLRASCNYKPGFIFNSTQLELCFIG